MTDDKVAVTQEDACPDCDGLGWQGVAVPRCCGGSQWECGARGCTGPEQAWEQEQCERCFGTGHAAIRKEAASITDPSNG